MRSMVAPATPNIPRLTHLDSRLVAADAPELAGLVIEHPSLADFGGGGTACKGRHGLFGD